MTTLRDAANLTIMVLWLLVVALAITVFYTGYIDPDAARALVYAVFWMAVAVFARITMGTPR